ncbi:hypothetical protein EYF80_050004 [Liparis tanakae]|uniref:Uncharacterized protein n=1 Tax=Liparis tanakae TaxID=230148 RepID=A0A4Z2FGE1_9TELE|nr:hypothetical protein EYF80_050004 [Liparis tanakae]
MEEGVKTNCYHVNNEDKPCLNHKPPYGTCSMQHCPPVAVQSAAAPVILIPPSVSLRPAGQGQFHAWARGADAAVEEGSLLWVAQPILSLAADLVILTWLSRSLHLVLTPFSPAARAFGFQYL